MKPHPSTRLDNTVHQRVRLGILTVLAEVPRAEFTYLRDALALTDGNLASNLRLLGEAGLVETDKVPERGRARTWVRATPAGRAALAAEARALRELLAGLELDD